MAFSTSSSRRAGQNTGIATSVPVDRSDRGARPGRRDVATAAIATASQHCGPVDAGRTVLYSGSAEHGDPHGRALGDTHVDRRPGHPRLSRTGRTCPGERPVARPPRHGSASPRAGHARGDRRAGPVLGQPPFRARAPPARGDLRRRVIVRSVHRPG
jgi:hypothetical protein